MPTYEFEHPKTGEIFEEFRLMADYDDPFFAPDGAECKRVMSKPATVIDKNQEVFEMDEDYVKLTDPKFVKYNDGHKEKYDPRKHRGGKGKNSDRFKPEDSVSLPKSGVPGKKIYKGGFWWCWNDKEDCWDKE